MVLKILGKCHPNGAGVLIYVPQAMALDSKFPLNGGDEVELKIVGKKLQIKKIEEVEGDPHG